MSGQEKPPKVSKLLRARAQEFLNNVERTECLQDILGHFRSGSDTHSCLLALEMVFGGLLKDRILQVEFIPYRTVSNNTGQPLRDSLVATYEHTFENIVQCMRHDSTKIQLQALATAMSLLGHEGRNPVQAEGQPQPSVPLQKLKQVLMEVLSVGQIKTQVINKYTEYLAHDDILFYTWKLLPSLTAKSSPRDTYIVNYLSLLEKMQMHRNADTQIMCSEGFNFDEFQTKRSLNKIWPCVMRWDHTPQTHKQLLIVLLEKALPHLDKPLFLTDFLMDSLDVGGPVSLLALQGIFTMISVHNLNYPNIFAKLYSMFEPEIFHTKYKARLFYLADLFLSSTHLPENMIAAFAKRLARLALIAPSEDVIIICHFIGNLILRHPGLKCLLNSTAAITASEDPYIMEERDPVKSNAMNSSLWEIQSLQRHCQPGVATAARFINSPLPSVEWDLGNVLERSGDDIFDKEIKKHGKLIVLQFSRPLGGALERGERVGQFWNY